MALQTSAFAAAEARGWTIRELSEKSGLPTSTLYEIKRGRRWPGPKTVTGLMRAFPDLPYERLFTPCGSANAVSESANTKAAA